MVSDRVEYRNFRSEDKWSYFVSGHRWLLVMSIKRPDPVHMMVHQDVCHVQAEASWNLEFMKGRRLCNLAKPT